MQEALEGHVASVVATRAGFSKQTLDGYRKGGMPSGDRLFRLADALGVSARWLATGEGPMKESNRMTEYNDADWVKLRELKSGQIVGDTMPEVGSAFVRRDELARFNVDADKLWVTRMPSTKQPDIAAEGETIVCTEPEDHLVDGAAYLLRVGSAVIARRFDHTKRDAWNPDGKATWTENFGTQEEPRLVEHQTVGRILATVSVRPA